MARKPQWFTYAETAKPLTKSETLVAKIFVKKMFEGVLIEIQLDNTKPMWRMETSV